MRPFNRGPKKARPSKTPKRVKPALDLLEKIIRKHGKCSYKALRDIACSSKLKRPEQEAALDSSIILVCPFAPPRIPGLAFNRRVGTHVRGIDQFVFSADYGDPQHITGTFMPPIDSRFQE
jgi:hypothetical protein